MLSISYFLFIIPVLLTLVIKFNKKNYFFNYLLFFSILIIFYIFFIKYSNGEGIISFLDYSNIFLIVTVLLDYIISSGIYISKFENRKFNKQNIGIKDLLYYIFFFISCSHAPLIIYQSNLLENFISKELKSCYGKVEYYQIFESFSYLLNSPEFWIVQIEVIITLILLMKLVFSIKKLVNKSNFEYKPKISLFVILSIIAFTIILFYYVEYFSPLNIEKTNLILPNYYIDMLKSKKFVYYIYFIIVYFLYTFFATLNEEVFCRFILIDSLRMNYSEKTSFIISIIYWVIAHFSIFEFIIKFDFIYLIYVFIIGILFTLLRIKKNSIILNVSIHYLINIINVLILFSRFYFS